jgi:Terminase large subunit, T4likevirus-type, N-terminal
LKQPYPFYKTSNPLLSEHSKDLDIFLGNPFWCGNVDTQCLDNCCFNHIIGLPEKNDKTYPIFDYELDVINKIENNRNVWIKKSAGIGATTLLLRYLVWKILVNNDLEYKNIFIVSGTHFRHANTVKVKMEDLFRNKFPFLKLDSKFTDLWIKNTNIKIFPSRNSKDLRGYTDVAYLFLDEADYWLDSEVSELLHAITRYEEKSNCTTIMVSTPNRPDGLFQSIEKDPSSKYYKIILDYTVGLGKIYDPEEIKKKMQKPEFPREYMGQYLGRVGNVFTSSQIDQCIELGKQYDTLKIPVSLYTLKSVGVDPGFSSSSTGIVVLEHIKEEDRHIIRVVSSELIDKGDPNRIVEYCWSLYKQNNFMNTFFFIDGSNRAMVNLLKIRWQESLYWENTEDFGKNSNIKIRPVNFSTEHRNMLGNLHAVVSKEYLAIPSKYDKLLTSLRTAYAEELNLKKDVTSYDDLFDALRLALKAYNFE